MTIPSNTPFQDAWERREMPELETQLRASLILEELKRCDGVLALDDAIAACLLGHKQTFETSAERVFNGALHAELVRIRETFAKPLLIDLATKASAFKNPMLVGPIANQDDDHA